MNTHKETEPGTSIPSSLSCSSVRLIIEQSALHFQRSESMLDVNVTGYEDQETQMGYDLTTASEAFEKRPVDCLMTVNTDDRYDCDRCNFMGDLSLSAQASDGFE